MSLSKPQRSSTTLQPWTTSSQPKPAQLSRRAARRSAERSGEKLGETPDVECFLPDASCDSARLVQGQACTPAQAGHRMHLTGLTLQRCCVLGDMPCPVLQRAEHLPRHYSIDISHSSGRWLGAWGLGPAGDLEKRINHSTKGPGQGKSEIIGRAQAPDTDTLPC